MFDIAPSEMLIVALVAIVLIGPKDLPRVMRVVGQWVGRGRTMARHFRGAIDDMIRESELQEMEKKWKAENERIMREYPSHPPSPGMPEAERAPPALGGRDAGRGEPGTGSPAPGDGEPPRDPRPLP